VSIEFVGDLHAALFANRAGIDNLIGTWIDAWQEQRR
jgi:hypothetical protein